MKPKDIKTASKAARQSTFINEFKKFAMRGNVLDMAVGIIIGAAFTTVITSLVQDVLNPPLGLLLGNADLSKYVITIATDPTTGETSTINYGAFLNAVINFLLVALSVFIMIKAVNRWRGLDKKAEAPKEKPCPFCTMPIPKEAKRCPECTSQIN